MKNQKKILLIVITLFLFIIGTVFSTGKKEAAKTLKIGTLMDLTGDLKEYGIPIRSGIELAVRQLIKAGLPITLVNADSETNPIAAVNAANKLVNIDQVLVIIGSLGSGVTQAVAEAVACPNNTLIITPSSTSPVLSNLPADTGKDFLFRTCPSDDLQGTIAGKIARERYKTVSVIYVNNSYGQGLAEAFKRSFEKEGGKVPAMVATEQEAESYTAELKAALKDNPDALAAFTYPESAIVYLREAIEFYNYKSFLFCDGTKSEKIIAALGASNIEGMIGTAPGSAGGESLVLFNQAYQNEFGKIPPLPFITNAYDATAAIGLAAYLTVVQDKPLTSVNIRNNLRTVTSKGGTIIRPGEFAKAFDLLKRGEKINYEGAASSVDFDEKGDVVTPFDIWQYSEGKIIVIKTVESLN